ncbi:hypothetical protein ACFUMH_00115 [Cellulomonas sp. NPDC057328]|uniref:hypothetical protein n=1 Tax=Cellulomonas sp. NPDC057328 TaxID=3346101 RepID=UPI00362F0BC6
MRVSSVLSEAWRDLVTGTTRAATLALVLAVGAGALAVLDARATVDVLRHAADFRAAGASTWVLEDRANVDGARCDGLTGVAGMRAGAVRQGDGLRARALPSSLLTVWEVTPGLLGAALGRPVDAGPGLWLSVDLAETLGVTAGGTLATTSGDARVAGTYTWPDDGRARSLGYAVVAPVAATGTFDACWAHTWPPDADTAALLHFTTGSATTSQPSLRQLNASLGEQMDVPGLLAARVTRWAPAAATVLGLALGWVGVRARRLQVAAALHARVPRAHLAWQLLVEAAGWVAVAAVVAAAACGWAAAAGNPDPGGGVWLGALRTVGAGCGAALLGTLTAAVTTRERHLFRYFKDR